MSVIRCQDIEGTRVEAVQVIVIVIDAYSMVTPWLAADVALTDSIQRERNLAFA